MTISTVPTTNRGRARARRRLAAVGAGIVLLATGCTTAPKVGSGTLATAKHRVLAEIDATTTLVAAPGPAKPQTTPDVLACTERLLGYTIRHLAEHRAEVRRTITTTARDGASLLPRVERRWKALGYTIDRHGLNDDRYPKLRTHIGSDLIVVTGYVGVGQVNLYAVSPCIRS